MKWDMNLWVKAVEGAVTSFSSRAVFVLPAILAAVAVILLGFMVAWLASRITRKALGWIRLDHLTKGTPLPGVLESAGYGKGMGGLLGKLVYWAIFLVFLSAAASIIGLPQVAGVIEAIFAYIPNVLASLIILTIGAYIANILGDFIVVFLEGSEVPYARYVAGAARTLVYVFVLVATLEQLGLGTSILLNNISIVIAGLALAFALSFGLGSRNALRDMVAMYCVRDLVKSKHTVQVGDTSGRIVDVTKTGVIIEDNKRKRQYIGGNTVMENCSVTTGQGVD